MKYYIGPIGPKDAELAIIAEKPGRDELLRLEQSGFGEPLIGASGKALDRHLSRIGTARSKVWLTNAVQNFDVLGNPTEADIKREQIRLFRELNNLPNLKCVVALGAAALASLSNFKYTDITNRRGSVLKTFAGTKMVPTYHPAFYMRGEWRYKSVVEFDLARALAESKTLSMPYLNRTYYIEPTFSEAMDWLDSLFGAKAISFDIELWRNPLALSCIAFSDAPNRAYCIPFLWNNRTQYWKTSQQIAIWRKLALILNQPKTRYITQNGLFDCWFLWRYGLKTEYMSYGFDTMYAHRVLYPDLPHTLAFLTSIYTTEPYYKDESGDWKSANRVPEKQFWLYNCKDSSVTFEIAIELQKDLNELGILSYYLDNVQAQWASLADMRERGLKVDKDYLVKLRASISSEREQAENELKHIINQNWLPNTKSPADMARLFAELGVKAIITPTGRPKYDEASLIHYTLQANESARQALFACLEITRRRTLESSFLTMVLDPRDYYHPMLDLGHARTGRNASKGAEEGGPQIQNIPKRIRKVFIPDDSDSIILNADYKQAESMYVAWDAQDELLIASFLAGKDIHRVRACILYHNWQSEELPPDDLMASVTTVCEPCASQGLDSCRHSERYMAKQAGHAFAYKMGAKKFMTLQAKEQIYVPLHEAERIRSQMISKSIALWHDRVATQIKTTARLRNPFGRIRQFLLLPDEETIRTGLSWLAQSTVADLTHSAMIKLHNQLAGSRNRILTDGHDALTLSVYKPDLPLVIELVKSAMLQTMIIHGRELTIPVEISSGPNWGDLKELT